MEGVTEDEFRERLKNMKEEGLKRTAEREKARKAELLQLATKRKEQRVSLEKKRIMLEKESKEIEELRQKLNEDFRKLKEEKIKLAAEKEKLNMNKKESNVVDVGKNPTKKEVYVEHMQSTSKRQAMIGSSKKNKTKKKKTPTLNLKQIEELRKKDRDRKRAEREKIKNDPERYLEYRLREKLRNDRRKESGQIKPISKMDRRSANAQRKQWRERQRRHRLRLNREKALDTPPSSPENQVVIAKPRESRQSVSGMKTIQKNRYKEKKHIQELMTQQKKREQQINMWKKRFFREKAKNAASPSPKKLASQIVKKGPKEVCRQLIYGCALQKQLKKNSETCTTRKEKREISKFVSGPVIKKAGLMKRLSIDSVSIHLQRRYAVKRDITDQKSRVGRIQKIRGLVIKYFLDDENSVQAPGKSQCITRKKVKKQKRFLLDSVRNLHKNFVSKTGIKISYSSFNMLKPFWVVAPKENDRDTCKCVKHANFDLMIRPLARNHILKVKSTKEVLKNIACSVESKDCMYGTCDKCKSKSIKDSAMDLTNVNVEDEITYCKWVRKKVDKIKKGKPKNESTIRENDAGNVSENKNVTQCTIVVKEKKRCKIRYLIDQLNSYLPQFCIHVYNAYHQRVFLNGAKKDLKTNEILIVVDWSENYLCRYAEEIQSMHFGGSRSQISLHTGVLYTKESKVKATSFCTISSSKYHGPSAIWSHLEPILNLIKDKFPNVDTLHFFSDGPTAQYRNKENFYLMARFAYDFNFWKVSWNLSEAGHGKGTADAIGGVVKRTADSILLKQTDIIDVHSFKEAVSSLGVLIYVVDETKISATEKGLPSCLTAIPKTMKIHQITWARTNPQTLGVRLLSCKDCTGSIICSHFPIDSGKFEMPNSIIAEPTTAPNTTENVQPGDWVSVIYDNTWYPGVVEEVTDQDMTINFMKRSGTFFVWPTKLDKQSVPLNGILSTLNPPIKVSSRLFKVENSDEIDQLCSIYVD
ncbi:uncharacterized protein LOC128996630 isoform X2 [Macrosteles quadrilineatus]|uniref:uncharacterized protein LOC128996630 isoform X2 n=1 Tax=Macrosteles quadrilineatus TaxID=74068 RepID=UPI0023E322F1|nr:uncharacterized protein LOC128996630 isoform X2 [Macrosteles quadrilineatus]